MVVPPGSTLIGLRHCPYASPHLVKLIIHTPRHSHKGQRTTASRIAATMTYGGFGRLVLWNRPRQAAPLLALGCQTWSGRTRMRRRSGSSKRVHVRSSSPGCRNFWTPRPRHDASASQWIRLTSCPVLFVCVGTPADRRGEARGGRRGCAQPGAAPRPVAVVEKSTVPAGTAIRLRQVLQRERPDLRDDVEVVSNPRILAGGPGCG